MAKRIIKICIDLIMFVLFLLLMEYHLLPKDVHEWFGISLFALFIAHNALNYKWYAVLFKGKYTAMRIVQPVVNFLLWVAMIVCVISSILISGTVFAWMNVNGAMTGRSLHLIATAWAFVLMSIHLGLHWGSFVGMAKWIKIPQLVGTIVKWALRVVVLGLAVYGVVVFVRRSFYEELFLLTEFKFFDYDTSRFAYLLQTLCMAISFVSIAYYVKKASLFIKKSRKAKEINNEEVS